MLEMGLAGAVPKRLGRSAVGDARVLVAYGYASGFFLVVWRKWLRGAMCVGGGGTSF